MRMGSVLIIWEQKMFIFIKYTHENHKNIESYRGLVSLIFVQKNIRLETNEYSVYSFQT